MLSVLPFVIHDEPDEVYVSTMLAWGETYAEIWPCINHEEEAKRIPNEYIVMNNGD